MSLEHSLAPGDEDIYSLRPPPGWYLVIEVEQRGTDVELRLGDSDGARRLRVDSPTGDRGVERLVFVSTDPAGHRVGVYADPSNPKPGRYVARVVVERPASARDRQEARADGHFARAYGWSRDGTAEGARRAEEAFEAAAELWRELGNRERLGETLQELGEIHAAAQRHQRAAESFRRRLALFGDEDHPDAVLALNSLGLALRDLGRTGEAGERFEEAARLARRLGDRRQEAAALLNLGRMTGRGGNPVEAIGHLTRSVGLLRSIRDPHLLPGALNVLGEAHWRVGEGERALVHHRRALGLLDSEAEYGERAATLNFIGRALVDLGELEDAREAYGECLDLYRRSGDEVGMARAWSGLGLVAKKAGDLEAAQRHYRRALGLYQRRGLLHDQGALLNNLAWLAYRRGHLGETRELHLRALEIRRFLGDHEGEATARLGLAAAARDAGHLEAALEHSERAVAMVEEALARGEAPQGLAGPKLGYRGARSDYHDLHVDVLMALHRERPGEGWDERALLAFERGRARLLLEALVSASPPDDEDRRSPWRDAVARPRSLSVVEMQRLLAPGTVLLEYHLGAERSFLWALTRDRLTSHRLPPAAEIEALARRAHRLLSSGDLRSRRAAVESTLAELAAVVLGPVADDLAHAGTPDPRRLLLVTNGPLEYVPFAALPLPAGPEPSAGPAPGGSADPRRPRRLVEDFEIVRLPSMAILAELRRHGAARKPPPNLLAVLADPVFGPSAEHLPRLPDSRREAEAILATASPHGPTFAALGLDAHRDLAVGGRLGTHRIVHFASHVLLDDRQPMRSAIILAGRRPDGTHRPDRLSLGDVQRLDLPADLVVLSGCRSALGKEMGGEGLLGLPRGFFLAGASRVLVSLWDVGDGSTATLMARFYRHHLDEGLPPAAALRSAQLSMLDEPRHAAPHHWAAFELQGEWR